MKTLIPVIGGSPGISAWHLLPLSFFIVAFFCINTASAQEPLYASISRMDKAYSHSSGNLDIIDPVVKVKVRSAKSIVLSWAPFSGAVSHYVLERSTDGSKFREEAVFFTGDGNKEPDYVFTNKFRHAYAGPLFYRLRVVGLDGSVVYTPYTILSADRP